MTAPVPDVPPAADVLRSPRLAIRVGVVGARNFGSNDASPPPWLHDRLRDLFRLIACKLSDIQQSDSHYNQERPLLRVVTGFADRSHPVRAPAAPHAGNTA